MKLRFENTKKDNKGFSLVELIVAVVILGIIAVVAIGGLYSNVAKARRNTDVSNARDIQSAVSTLSTDKDVFNWGKAQTSATPTTITWKGTHRVNWGFISSIASEAISDDISDLSFLGKGTLLGKMASILPDGLPAVKSSGCYFELTVTPEIKDGKGTGNVSFKCVVKDSSNTVLTEAE